MLLGKALSGGLAIQAIRLLDGLIRANTIREIRGRGLMLAVELRPEAGDARRYCEALQRRGIQAKDT
jgi:ornithine--oxo-acid transaminase